MDQPSTGIRLHHESRPLRLHGRCGASGIGRTRGLFPPFPGPSICWRLHTPVSAQAVLSRETVETPESGAGVSAFQVPIAQHKTLM
jgi:hypothetical protein